MAAPQHRSASGTERSENTAPSATEDDASEGEDDIYEVEKIVGMTTSKGKTLFKVRWAGYSPSWDTWEPYENLESCKDIVDDYIKTHSGKSSVKTKSSAPSKVCTITKSSENHSDAGSDSSKQSAKSRKATYYYVDADGAEADTLKDKFWRNLEQGKINVFGNDMYSKVKNTGRSARPSSFKEAFQSSVRETVPTEEEGPNDKKRRLSKSTETKSESKAKSSESSSRSKTTTKSRTSVNRKAVSEATAKANRKQATEQEKQEHTSGGRTKLQRSKAQTARKRINQILTDSGSKELPLLEDEDTVESDAETPITSSSSVGVSETSYGSTEEELQAEDTQRSVYDHAVVGGFDDSHAQFEELHGGDDVPHAEFLEEANRLQHKVPVEEVEVIDLVDDDTETDDPPERALELKRGRQELAKGPECEEASDSNEDGKDRCGDQKLASPCKVLVKRILPSSVQPLDESEECDENRDEYEVHIVQPTREVETDANANVRRKGIGERDKKRKSTEAFASQREIHVLHGAETTQLSSDTVAKRRRSRKGSNASGTNSEPTNVVDKGTVPIGPPAGAAQQAAKLFRTKASVKIYDPTQTSSPNSSEQSHTPQTPDVPPQTPVTPDGNANSQQPLSVSSGAGDTQPGAVQPSPSTVIPSPTTPRTPSTSGNDDGLFDIDLDEIDLSAWDSVVPADSKQTEILELSNVEFRHAVHTNNYDRIRSALNSRRKYDLEQPDAQGMTLVMVAAYFGYDDAMELLVCNGADVNARQKNGMTALMHACQQGHRCTVELLILLGACVNPHQHNGETALFKGVKKGNKHIVRLLLEHGANFAAQAQDNTALKLAKQLPSSDEIIDVLNSHITNVTSEFESQVQITLNNTATIQCALFPMQCFALCEADKFRITFNHDLQPTRPGVGMLLFVAHAKFTKHEVKCRFYGPCAVASAVLNGVTLRPLTEEANFVLSFSPLHHGRNDLDIHTVKAPKSMAKLVVCAYKAQLT